MVEYCPNVVEHVLDPHNVDRKVIALRIRAAHAHAAMLHHDDVESLFDHVAPQNLVREHARHARPVGKDHDRGKLGLIAGPHIPERE